MNQVTSDDPFIAWWDKYRPTGTPTENSGPIVGDTPRLFGYSGTDWEAVKAADTANPFTVWTLVECDGLQFVMSGLHYVNRMGYFITEVPAENDAIEVKVDDDDDLDDDHDDEEYVGH